MTSSPNISERILALSSSQLEAFKSHLSQDGVDLSTVPVQPRTDKHAVLPLIPAQRRILLLSMMNPNSTEFNIVSNALILNPLDVEVFEESLSMLVNKHEALRLRIRIDNGIPHQFVDPEFSWQLSVIDYPESSRSKRHEIYNERIHYHQSTPFDLDKGPLFRFELVKLAENEVLFISSYHHVIMDGWSLKILLLELGSIYKARMENAKSIDYGQQSLQFLDFAIWQLARIKAGTIQPHLDYWHDRLCQSNKMLDLPTDYAYPSWRDSSGAAYNVELPSQLASGLGTVAKQYSVSISTLFLSLYALILARYSGQENIVTGMPAHGRTRPELEELVGILFNTLAIRIDVPNKGSFGDFCKANQKVIEDALTHQDAPLEMVVDSLNVSRNTSRQPVIQTMFVFAEGIDVPDTETFDSSHVPSVKYELNLLITKTDQTIRCVVEYATALFTASTIERFVKHLLAAAQRVLDNPALEMGELPIATEDEIHAQRCILNSSDEKLATPMNLLGTFETSIRERSDDLAIVDCRNAMSYAEVDTQSDVVAKWLQEQPFNSEEFPVGVFIEHSIEMVVAIIGILKAGGCYVPVDASTPQQRMIGIFENAEVSYVLTDQEEVFSGDVGSTINFTMLKSILESGSEPNESPKPVSIPGENLAYIIYTSGTTGTPKGVMIEHASAANTIRDINQRFEVTNRDCILGFSSIGFDLSVYDIFGTLAAGGKLVLVDPARRNDPAHLVELMHNHGVTVWNSIPSAMEMIVEYLEKSDLSFPDSLRLVLLSGDWIPTSLPDRVRARGNGIEIISMGGATEASIWSIYYPVGEVDPAWKSIPYGSPLANQSIYVLDQTLNVCPPNVPGEIYIGGVGVARGYHGDPERTDEKFIIHPQWNERLYRTGDFGKLGTDGIVEFLGRKDHQVKIRGFRIELGEIEHVIGRYPGVERAVVRVTELQRGIKRIIAFIRFDDENATEQQLRTFAKQFLPTYMIPQSYIFVDEFPITSNGKLDQDTLMQLWNESSIPESTNVPPATDAERSLVKIWCHLLGYESLSVTDNFFDLGGDSIINIQMISIAAESNLHFSMQDVFTHQTIRELAASANGPPARGD